MVYMHENAKPFFIEGNNIGCLLIHGFTGSPSEMRLLGNYLNKKGYTVMGVLLKGHGTSVDDMEKTTWRDWLKSAELGLIELKHKCDKIVVIGLSMGGIIALNLASRFDVDCVVTLAAPIRISNPKAYFSPIIKYFRKYIIKPKKKVEDYIKDYHICYDRTPVASVPHLLKLIRKTKWRLRKIKVPILIIQSKKDNTVKYESAEYIFKNVKSEMKKLVFLEKSGHVVTIGCEKEKVFAEIEEFLNQLNLKGK